MQFTVELVSSPIQKDRASAFNLYRDWLFARSRLWAEAVTKLWYFRQLPWHLLAIAHHKRDIGIKAARECMAMYDNPDCPGREHRQSQRS